MPPLCTPEKNQSRQSNEEKEEEEPTTTESDYQKQKIQRLGDEFPELREHFDVHCQVGEGTFSAVYVATMKNNQTKKFAIKHMVRTCHPDRVRSELECLKKIGGVDNVVGIDFCLRNRDNIVFIMPYLKHQHFNSYVGKMDSQETALYMRNLLIAVARVHEFNIIHRDVKPSNFLYDRINKKFLLVDFGLAQPVAVKAEAVKRKRESESPAAPEAKKRHLIEQASPLHSTPEVKNGVQSQKENVPVESAKMYNKDIEQTKVTVKTLITSPKEVPKIQTRFSKGMSSLSTHTPKKNHCLCYGKPRTCSVCLSYKPQYASRAGTPGFRPPEVLLKSQNQTTAVDIWACGIIMLSILSNRGNFFSNPDDITALAEMVTIFGHEAIKKVATQCGQYFITSEKKKPLDLQKVCCFLRNNKQIDKKTLSKTECGNCLQPDNYCVCAGTITNKSVTDDFPKPAYDLLRKLLDVNPQTRITAKQALEHEFLKESNIT